MGKFDLLPLAMQVGQLDGVEGPHPVSEVPRFVEEYFSMVPRETVSRYLAEWWRVAGLDELLHSQQPYWQAVTSDVTSAVGPVCVEKFEARFYGRFPYRAVPVANMPFVGA